MLCLFPILILIHAVLQQTTMERVMIDPATFRLFKTCSRLMRSVSRKLDPTSLTDEQYMICTPVLLGFCFGTKAWGTCNGYTREVQK